MSVNVNAGFNENFTTIYRKFSKFIIKFLYGIVFNREISEELSQDVFVKLYEKRVVLDPDSNNTLNYLFTMAKNIAIDYLRRDKSEVKNYRAIHFKEVVMNKKFYKDLEDLYLSGEIISTLNDTINSFPEKKQDVFVEKEFNNKSNGYISKKVSISKYRINKIDEEIKMKIKDNLKKYFE